MPHGWSHVPVVPEFIYWNILEDLLGSHLPNESLKFLSTSEVLRLFLQSLPTSELVV